MPESAAFQQQKQASLNNLANNAVSWNVDVKYFREVLHAVGLAEFGAAMHSTK
jgi:hypothetical protein